MTKHQKRIKGGRKNTNSSVIKELHKLIEQEARRNHCSKSWVTAYAISAHFGIRCEPYWK
jgi:hypothetical protein